jgi:hypothetical protein
MSQFMNDVMSDIRGGRESWRIFLTFCAPAAALAIVLAIS